MSDDADDPRVYRLAEAIAYAMYPEQTVADDRDLIDVFMEAARRALADFDRPPTTL